jgi:hypothetical protein
MSLIQDHRVWLAQLMSSIGIQRSAGQEHKHTWIQALKTGEIAG